MKRIISLFFAFFLCPLLVASHSKSGEYELKAAYLFHFTKYVEFPDNAFSGSSSRFVVGILGEDRFGGAIDSAFDGQSVDGHQITVKRFSEVQQAKGCHILFICPSERNRLGTIVSAFKGTTTLTVADTSGSADKGVDVELFVEDNKIRFIVNIASARAAHLKISSKLLSLAKKVIGN